MSLRKASLAVVATLLLVPYSRPQAQVREIPADPVDRIEFRGLETVSDQLVRSQIESQVGQPINFSAIGRDIPRLYALGRFSDVQVLFDVIDGELVLIYAFEETRIIDELRIVGNDKVRDRLIRENISWREGDSFVEEAYEEERNSVLDLYQSKGFLNASVDIVVEEIGESRVRVTYFIDEGRKARIRSLNFVGNETLNDRRLRKIVKTSPRRFIIGGKYDEEKFEQDLRAIRAEYGNVGHLEAEVVRTEFDYAPKGKRFDITVYIYEGPRYRVANVDFSGNIAFGDTELRGLTNVSEGDIHNVSAVAADSARIGNTYTDSGYVEVAARDIVTLNDEDHTTNVVHQIDEGQLKYIRQIKITGNNVTRDDVIRREVLLSPGDRYDGGLKRLSENRLARLQYFEPPPQISLDDPLADDRFVDLLVDVQEGRTGNFNFGGSFSTDESYGGFIELDLRNFDISNWPTFSGGGQRFQTRLFIGDIRNSFNVSFTDPEIFGYPFSFGVDAFNLNYRTQGASDYEQETLGGRIRIGKQLSNFNFLNASFRYTDTEINDLDTFVDPDLRDLEDPGTTISTAWTFSRNTLDNYQIPTDGATHAFTLELAGLGGDNEFVKFDHESVWYFTPQESRKWTFLYQTREGIAAPYGSSDLLPLDDRYFAGGTATVRGYEQRDIGPKAFTFRDVNGQIFVDDEAIGGELRLLNTVEARYNLSELINLFTFVDGGGVWLEPEDFDPGDLQFSWGVGFGFNAPVIGPIRVDYAFPLNLEDDNKSSSSGRLHLRASFAFR